MKSVVVSVLLLSVFLANSSGYITKRQDPAPEKKKGDATANALSTEGIANANAVSRSGGNALANAINGTAANANAMAQKEGNASANAISHGDGGTKANALAQGNGTADANAISKGPAGSLTPEEEERVAFLSNFKIL